MSDPGGVLEYARHTVPLGAGTARRDLFDAIARLRREVVVNIAPARDAGAVLFLEETLQAALAGNPPALVLETLPAARHRSLMRGKIEQALASAQALRGALGQYFVAHAAGDINGMLAQIDQLVLLLRGYVLQDSRPAAAKALEAVQCARADLVAGVEAHDNVRCMDALHYLLTPALNAAGKLFR